jgi:hypothetical protein
MNFSLLYSPVCTRKRRGDSRHADLGICVLSLWSVRNGSLEHHGQKGKYQPQCVRFQVGHIVVGLHQDRLRQFGDCREELCRLGIGTSKPKKVK